MANKYLSINFSTPATYDWNTDSIWSTTAPGSGVLGPANTTKPTTGDTVFLYTPYGITTNSILQISTNAQCSVLSGEGASPLYGNFSGTLAFTSGSAININATTGTVFNMYNSFGIANITGRFAVNLVGNASSTRTIAYGTTSTFNSESTALDITVTTGSGSVALTGSTPTFRNFNSSSASGGLSIPATIATTVYGNINLNSVGINSTTGILTFAATSGTQQISGSGNFNCPITFGVTGSTATKYQLQSNITVGSATSRAITFVAGTFDFNNYTLNHYGTVTRTGTNNLYLNFGISGVYNNTLAITTGNNTVWNLPILTNFYISPYSKAKFNGNSTSGVQSVLHGSTTGDESKALGFFPKSSNYPSRLTFNGYMGDFDLSGFYAAYPALNQTIYGSFTPNGQSSYAPGSSTNGVVMAASLAYSPSDGVGYVLNQEYQIVTIGTTDFTAIGASANTVGTVFTFNGVTSQAGTTGTAIPVRYIIWNDGAGGVFYAPPITIGNGTSQSYVKITGTGFSTFGIPLSLTYLNLLSGTFDTNTQPFQVTYLTYNNSNTKKLRIDNIAYLISNSSTSYNSSGQASFTGITTGTTLDCNNTNTSIQFQESVGTTNNAYFYVNGGTFKEVKIITNPSNTVNYPLNLRINSGATSVTIGTLSNQGQTCTFIFSAGSTTYLTDLTANITTGTTVYLRSSTTGTQATLSSSTSIISVSNYDIQDSNATGGASWRAYTDTNGNVNSGNNSGWIFSSGAGGTNKFFLMF
jgi:hypothetical protein